MKKFTQKILILLICGSAATATIAAETDPEMCKKKCEKIDSKPFCIADTNCKWTSEATSGEEQTVAEYCTCADSQQQ